MKKIVSLLFLLLASSRSHAFGFSNPVSEITFAPGIGYSTQSGASVALEAGALMPIHEEWDAKIGFDAYSSPFDSTVDGRLGLVYNFSEDRADAYFAGFGIESYKRYLFNDDSLELEKRTMGRGYVELGKRTMGRGYVELGKRFAFKSLPRLSYSPYIKMNSLNGGGMQIHFAVLNFSYVF